MENDVEKFLDVITEMASSCNKTKEYKNQDFDWLPINGSATLFASPDCTYHAVKEALNDVGNSNELLIAMYDFSVHYISDIIRNLAGRAISIKLMVDKDSRKTPNKSEVAVIRELQEAGATCTWSPSCNNDDIQIFTNCHEKVFIFSNNGKPKKLMISSGNWSPGGIPPNIWNKAGNALESKYNDGNRDWGVIIENDTIAQQFYKILGEDFEEAKSHESSSPFSEQIEAEPLEDIFVENITKDPKKIFPVKKISLEGVKILPLMSPDNYYSVVKQLIQNARKSIKIQQQSVSVNGKQGNVKEIVDLICSAKKTHSELIIQFMRSSKTFGRPLSESESNTLDRLRENGCEVKFHNPLQYDHLHNKGILIDDDIVIITSTNFTDTSIHDNRECGIVINEASVADYFNDLFDLDWNNGVSDILDKPMDIVTPSNEKYKSRPDNFHRISRADYLDSEMSQDR
jgi:phosphatidylserine/phosphatidylglycerophosphate/cardiolipin synthase-like enzyme